MGGSPVKIALPQGGVSASANTASHVRDLLAWSLSPQKGPGYPHPCLATTTTSTTLVWSSQQSRSWTPQDTLVAPRADPVGADGQGEPVVSPLPQGECESPEKKEVKPRAMLA